MTTERLVVIGALLLVAGGLTLACVSGTTPRLDLGPDAPAVARHGCELANQRCSRCHSIERVLATRVSEPKQWQSYVRRMRLQPASGISPADEAVIVDCLVRHSFGAAGLDVLHGTEAP